MVPKGSIHQLSIQNIKALKNHLNDILFFNNELFRIHHVLFINILRNCEIPRFIFNYECNTCCRDRGIQLFNEEKGKE